MKSSKQLMLYLIIKNKRKRKMNLIFINNLNIRNFLSYTRQQCFYTLLKFYLTCYPDIIFQLKKLKERRDKIVSFKLSNEYKYSLNLYKKNNLASS